MSALEGKSAGAPVLGCAGRAGVIVVGGGAAGMLAAAVAAERGAEVTLLEQNKETGKKLRITGKGRCNLTNNCAPAEVIENIPTGGRFLYSSLNAFPPADVMGLFESLGVPLKTERGGRVFPCSDKAADIVFALRRYMGDNGVAVRRCRAAGIIAEDGKALGVATSDGDLFCRAVILATGGISYPATGSTGDGYEFARQLGHTITPLRASLVPLIAEPEVCKKMQGLTLKNVRLSVFEGEGGRGKGNAGGGSGGGGLDGGCGKGKPVFEDFGELLFTHFGISGPLTLSASAHLRDDGFHGGGAKYYALIDFKPALDEKKLDARVLRDFSKYSNRDLANVLGELLPRLCIPVVLDKSGLSPSAKVHSVTRDERLRLVRTLKAFRLRLDGPRPVEEAVITSGGVDLREINPKTMESKLVSGLYFAGEIIDADAYTGGFNLQIAWSTAFAAAKAAAAALG